MQVVSQVNKSLTHFGVLGMKWGVRRYQNKDGTLTRDGKQKYIGVRTSDGLRRDRVGVTKGRKTSRLEKLSARKEYIKTEKEARKKYEAIAGTTRAKTGKEFLDTFSGVAGGFFILSSAAIITKMATGENYVSKIFDIISD